MHLTAVLIVKNEERFLEKCLSSIENHADDIVVVDTGSKDTSRQIALDHGARVIDTLWNGDFAKARNLGLDAARGDWILYIDADERLVRFDRTNIEPIFADPACVACTVAFHPSRGYTAYREMRVFRSRPDIRFKGKIHETVMPDLQVLRDRQGMVFRDIDATIEHDGYDGDQRHKFERNIPLLHARLAQEPDHVYCRDHLGQCLLGLGDENGAEREFRAAIESSRHSATASAADSLPYLHLATLLMDSGKDARGIIVEATGRFPENHALTWLHARMHFECGQYASALKMFERVEEADLAASAHDRVAYDRSIFGPALYVALGQCLLKLGRYEESEARFAKGESLDPGNLELSTKRQWAALLARTDKSS
jgi:tetratricopeptide (TPR) repeat protein